MPGEKKQDAPEEPLVVPPEEDEEEPIAIEFPHEDGDENAQPV